MNGDGENDLGDEADNLLLPLDNSWNREVGFIKSLRTQETPVHDKAQPACRWMVYRVMSLNRMSVVASANSIQAMVIMVGPYPP